MPITIALAGNPNSGKTTLFNAITGSNQFVGNWPGVTVEKKEGKLKNQKDVKVMDLPGIYSLSPYTLEEVVARNYIIESKPEVILNIIDGTNLERNLYLTTQLIETGIPVVAAINMMDIVKKSGDIIDIAKLSKKLGCEIVEISALKESGINEAAEVAIKAAKGKTNAMYCKFSDDIEFALEKITSLMDADVPDKEKRFFAIKLFERDAKISQLMKNPPDVESIISAVEDKEDDDSESLITDGRYQYITSLIKDSYVKKNRGKMTTSDKIDRFVTNRFAALPFFAVVMILVYYISVTTVGGWATDWANEGLFGDGFHFLGIGSSAYNEKLDEFDLNQDKISAFIEAAEKAGLDSKSVKEALAFDAEEYEDSAEREAAENEAKAVIADFIAQAASVKAEASIEDEDGSVEIIPVTLGDFETAITVAEPDPADFGAWVPGVPILFEKLLSSIDAADWLHGLVIDGIVAGVGAVLGFVPQMLVLFLFLAFLEACGYMARIAFIMDRVFRRFGLSGKSFIPILIGTGCGVPGIMASRTIENERDRRMTIITTTFIPCGAKLPIIALISGALFGGAWWVAPSAYFIGIAAIISSGVLLKKTKMFSGDTAPFVMELPNYHLPTVSNLFRSMWERGWSFIKKAGTIILLSSIIIWFLSSFGFSDGRFGMVDDLNNGLLAVIGGAFAWVFTPLGFGTWQSAVATITGLIAKENVVGTFGILFGFGEVAENGAEIWTALAAHFTTSAAFSFLVFNLLCAPCFAAIGAIRREMNSSKWTLFAIAYQTGFAYAIALICYQFGMLFSGGGFGIWTAAAIVVSVGFIYMIFRKNKYDTALSSKKRKTT